MTTSSYRIVVDGEFDEVTAAGFPETELVPAAGRTTLYTPCVDQAGLCGLLDRLRNVGVDLVALERLESISPA